MKTTTNTDPVALDASLTVDMKTIARWTNCGNQFSCAATVVKVNGKSLVVTLDETIDGTLGKYPQGWRITLPRLMGQGWSINNCVAPLAV